MELILIRGLPGSGKSTLAKKLKDFEHYEADMYFIGTSGEYQFHPGLIKDAHAWCQTQVWKALSNGKNVVVSNTFTRHWEMEPYFDMARTFSIDPLVIVTKGNWKNVHNVPDEVIEKMRNRWEE